jgi:putative two-component system response regulator
MTQEELSALTNRLQHAFDIVRLVDVSTATPYSFSSSNELSAEEHTCFSAWDRTRRCSNCISAKALAEKSSGSKFEFVDDDIYFVNVMYLEVSGTPYVLELVKKINDELFPDVYEKLAYIKKIDKFNHTLYIDELTGTFNRNYYEEQVLPLHPTHAVAVIEVDQLEHLTEAYGERAGKLAIRTFADTISACIRESDILIRYSKDEFVIAFSSIDRSEFHEKLENIHQKIRHSTVEGCDYGTLQLTCSIGGCYIDQPFNDILSKALALSKTARGKGNTVLVEYEAPI